MENIKKNILRSITPPHPEDRDVYAIMCKNSVQPDWSQMAIQ